MSDSRPFETLLKSKKEKDRWYPNSVDALKKALSLKDENLLRSNLAYNLQYLEYIQFQLNSLRLSEVLSKMLIKSFVIAGMGIIEALLTHLLKREGEWKKDEWELIKKITSNTVKINDDDNKVETHLFKKVEPRDSYMVFDAMIEKVEKKRLLKIDHKHFPTLKKLKTLRNRVHLQEGKHGSDTDYNNFDEVVLNSMQDILHSVLTHSKFLSKAEYATVYEFLKENKISPVVSMEIVNFESA